MSQIKKVFFALAILVLVLPVGVSAQSVSGGFCVEGSSFSFCAGDGSGSGGGSMGDFGLPGGTIFGIIENIAFWLLGVFALFGVIGFVVSGIMYLVSAGNDEMITKAKKYMMYSILGVVVGLMGFVIIQAAYSMLEGAFF